MTLVAQGALPPLLALVEAGGAASADHPSRHSASIAAWALCNLVKGRAAAAMASLAALPGFTRAVLGAMRSRRSWDLVMEARCRAALRLRASQAPQDARRTRAQRTQQHKM